MLFLKKSLIGKVPSLGRLVGTSGLTDGGRCHTQWDAIGAERSGLPCLCTARKQGDSTSASAFGKPLRLLLPGLGPMPRPVTPAIGERKKERKKDG